MPIEQAQAIAASRESDLCAQLAAQAGDWAGPVTLEIGCGHGHFMAAYAAAHRAERCLAIDIMRDRLERAQRKTDRAGLTNVVFLRAEARMLVENLPENLRLDRIFVLFPDPWPKRRHHKNRLMQAGFLSALAQHCAPDARLFFRTDHAPYFAAAAALLGSHPDWRCVDEPWPFEQPTVFQTRAPAFQSCVAALRHPA
ncbi:MAG: methyltransferase domain-containing protein [Opitutaceae bacterium]|nr:methyltransferase domain-containing protein [Opitutaceae bacterium]